MAPLTAPLPPSVAGAGATQSEHLLWITYAANGQLEQNEQMNKGGALGVPGPQPLLPPARGCACILSLTHTRTLGT